MKYCSDCGAQVELKIPEGDSLPRYVCTACATVHYQNPKIIAGCIPEWEDQVLLCKRAIEPRYGYWTLPAGFMENAETLAQAARRETFEEAGAQLADELHLHSVYSIPHISQVYVIFRATLANLDFTPGVESLETALFKESEIPWDDLAFSVVKEILKAYWQDRSRDLFPVHVQDMIKKP